MADLPLSYLNYTVALPDFRDATKTEFPKPSLSFCHSRLIEGVHFVIPRGEIDHPIRHRGRTINHTSSGKTPE